MDSPPGANAQDARRLALGQLMLWMLATCVQLAHEKWRLSSGENQDEAFLWYANIHAVVYCPLRAAGMAGLILCVWRRVRGGPPFPTKPGHWFLVLQGATNVIAATWELLNVWIGSDELLGYLPPWFYFGELILFESMVVALILWATVQPWSNFWWRAAFLVMALNPLSTVLHTTLVHLLTSGAWLMNELGWSIGLRLVYSLPAVFALLAATADWRVGRRHDFLHWVGIALVAAFALLEWTTWIIWRHLFR
jgi:hypothetical protein